MKNIAILGGTRFIGVHLLMALHKQGHKITLFNRILTPSPFLIPRAIRRVKGDRNNPNDLKNLFDQEFDVVFDFSGYTPFHISPIISHHQSKIKHYIFCSTSFVYKMPPPCPIDESSPRLFDKNLYGGNKALIEDMLLEQYNENAWKVTVFRPQGIFGPYDAWKAGFVIYRLVESLPIFVLSNQNTRFNPLFVEDLVSACIKAMNNPISYGKIYGVAGDDDPTAQEFIEICGNISAYKPNIQFVEGQDLYLKNKYRIKWYDHNLVTDNQRIKEDLHITFTPLHTGLSKTYSWLQDNTHYLKNYAMPGEKYLLKDKPIPNRLKLIWVARDTIQLFRRIVISIPYMRRIHSKVKKFLN